MTRGAPANELASCRSGKAGAALDATAGDRDGADLLANLLQVPNDEASWNRYSFNLRTEVDRVNAAILAQRNVSLPTYQLDPINWNDVYSWLSAVSQSFIAFTSVLGLQSQDLLSVDLRDVRQRQSWVWVAYSQIRDAEAALGI